jgi:hypothetical protein
MVKSPIDCVSNMQFGLWMLPPNVGIHNGKRNQNFNDSLAVIEIENPFGDFIASRLITVKTNLQFICVTFLRSSPSGRVENVPARSSVDDAGC